ncbi:MAG: glycosyltransferase [Fischerella sp. CENA71]|nr:glycosyltransferase [Fischerella sp. CENA71]
MENSTKPRLVFFKWRYKRAPDFMKLHMQLHVKCLSEFFEVIVVNDDCDYQQICDQYQPDLTLFESGVKYIAERINIKNTFAYPQIPKLGFHNGDSWCDCRPGFLSDMEHWGIETFFSICTTTAEYTPEIADNLFVWPNFIDADMYRDYNQPKIIPLLLTGATGAEYPWRQRIYKIIAQYYPSLICPHAGYDKRSTSRMIFGEQYARTINASWCVPTCGSVVKEIVRKHFEIPASKSCLLTEKSSALEAAGFVDMDNCVFIDEHNLLDKLDYLFHNLDVLERITNTGYQLVHSRHTLKQRDQIFQWFNLYKNLKPNQNIVQRSPFEPLTIVETSSGIKNSHIICNGLSVELLRQGDEQLWVGKYEEAENFYLRCLNYTCMPEPKLRLAICKLYKGDAVAAHYWLVQLIKYTLEEYKALDPEPVEWAYFIISLLCQGKLNEAINRAKQFPSLSHPELDRIRWVINILSNRDEFTLPCSDKSRYRYSIHQLPNRNLNEWINHLCIMLKECQQTQFSEKLSQIFQSEPQSLNKDQNNRCDLTTELLIKYQNHFVIKLSTILSSVFQGQHRLRPDYIIKLRRLIYFKILLPSLKILHALENKSGYFLPYNLSVRKNDELFHKIQKLLSEEDVKTAILIGASANEGSTEAFLTGIQKNQNKPIAICINFSTPKFVKLQTRYTNDFYVKCYDISSILDKNVSHILDLVINKIQKSNQIHHFDVMVIDSSELTISAELSSMCEAKFVILDDISTFENYNNYQKLLLTPNYVLVAHNPSLRNGYAIFKKVNN